MPTRTPSAVSLRPIYPGTIESAGATTIAVPFGADAPLTTFALVPAKTFTVSGTMVAADGRPVSGRGTVWLVTPDRLKRADFNIARGATMTDGTFVLRNVPQGAYTLQGFAPPPPTGPAGRAMNLGAMPFGWLPIAVGDADLDGLVLKTSEGTTLRGRFVADDSSGSPLAANAVGLMTIPVEFDAAPVGGGPSPSEVHDDLTFQLTHQSGLRRIFVSVRAPWSLKKITLAGRDITDEPIDLREKDVDGVEVVLTSKPSRVAGGVSDEKGIVADYAVVIFPSDPTKWIDRSRFVVVARPTPQGRFLSSSLPPDDYLAIALPSASPLEIYDPELLQSLRAAGDVVHARRGRDDNAGAEAASPLRTSASPVLSHTSRRVCRRARRDAKNAEATARRGVRARHAHSLVRA